jgi:hypothetical protein
MEEKNQANLQVKYGNPGGQTEKNHNKPHNSHCPGQDLNQEHPKYKSQPLLFELICSERLRTCTSLGGGILRGLTCYENNTCGVSILIWGEEHVRTHGSWDQSKNLKGRDITRLAGIAGRRILKWLIVILCYTPFIIIIPHTWCSQSQLCLSLLVTHCHSCNWLFISLFPFL